MGKLFYIGTQITAASTFFIELQPILQCAFLAVGVIGGIVTIFKKHKK